MPYAWGATADERARSYPADTLLADPTVRLTRAVDVAAPADLTYRWLCQISLAPYSYDWIDNLGRHSPPELQPSTETLAVGQRLMVFELVEVEPGHRFSAVMLPAPRRVFGACAITYAAEPVDPARSRIVCRLATAAHGPLAGLRTWLLAAGDLVMMRKQLLTLRDYAERDAAASRAIRSRNGS